LLLNRCATDFPWIFCGHELNLLPQVLSIQQAKIRGAKRFTFEGTELGLKPTCCPFITMNPGYAGRAELPDNLKVLFRTVAMMVPDYAMISEIILYSMGYMAAKAMAIKITSTYRLCSEQLSSQSHYDYGMRAVMAVLRAAGNLKRSEAHLPEEVLVLRSIMDVNMPKFLNFDVPLFNGIVSDLFPGVTVPDPDRDAMLHAFHESCACLELQATPYLWEKMVQIYDMMVVRHGFMVVGSPFAGKTSAWRALQSSLSALHSAHPEDMRWSKVSVSVMNPKSITMGQLYGQFDPTTHEWSDGVLAIQYRTAVKSEAPGRKWVLFDGPVDAIWIENMNTVLDDNKKLCLMSGEIIAMTDSMSMMFEPMDLLVASPATVSRCGMIYMEAEKLGWRPLLDSWIVRHASEGESASEKQSCHTSTSSLCFSQCEVQLLTELCDWLVEPCLAFLRKAMTELSPTVDSNLVQSLLNVFECILHTLPSGLRQAQDVECAFLVAVTWSLGSSAAAESQARWCTFVREYMADATCIPREWPGVANSLQVRQWSPPQLDAEGRKFSGAFSLPMPPGLAHSYWYSTTSRKWVLWDDVLPNPAEPLKPPPGGDVSDIIVPNVRTVQHGTLLVTLLSRDKNVLVCGPTGTGKSVYTAHCLSTLPDVRVLPLNFSAKTSASMAQEIICTGLDRRRKGVLGPPLGQRAVVFVDDLNMPEVETYGAQPPIELLRQVVDNGGWYGVKEVGMPWQQVVDVTLVAAMGPAGGGRNIVTPRLLRHFNLLCFQDFDDQTLTHIFTSIMEWKLAAEFSPQVQSAARTIVAATLDVYRSTMNVLRPTPSKSHYTFNLRDFSRVVQGVLMVAPHRCRSTDGLVRLWMHECLRVFSDRLVEDQDRIWFEQDLSRAVSHHFDGLSVGTLLRHLNEQEQEVSPEPRLTRLIFGDVCNSGESREYREMTDLGSLKLAMENVLEEYNSCSRKPMNLVLFSYAIEHICRIARILRMPGGNALLVGVGGSGRQSCAQLAVHVVDHAIFRIEISRSYGVNEWREDLKSVLTAAGTGPRPVVFFFSDVQIKDESFVEDLSNILNSGDVPNLFAADESANLCEAMRPHAKQLLGKAAGSLTSVQLREMFVARARRNLHVVLTFSPIGQAFRDRLRKFPSLVNCCAINWFTSWPEDALIAVASQHLQGIDLDQDEGGEHTRQALVRSCQTFHTDANVLSQVMSSTLRRTNYVTPTSYLELILAFKSSLSERRAKIRGARERYLAGLQKIAMATESVNKMQKELEEMQPILVQSAKDTEVLMAEISKKLPGVEAKRQEVSSDAAVTQASADECQLQKQSVEEDLAEALPALEMAIRALDTIKQSEINEVKILSKPPSGVKVVCEAVCVMLGIKPQRIPDPEDPSKRIMDFWGPSQKMLGDPDFINQLKTYDKDNIPPKTIAEIRKKYVTDPRFTPEAAEKASKAAAGLCKWVYAMETYERVSAVVGPKKEALLEAEAELARTMEGLHAKQAELKQVEDGLSALQSQYDAAVQKKQDLEDQAANTSIQIERATTLIAGLGGERERWEEFAVRLGTQYACSTGDVLVSAGVMAYLGPFTAMLRQRQVSTWVSSCKASGIPCSESPTLSGTLGEPLKIRQWNIDGLPTDSFSVDNAIIIFSARRWPLMIDPQGQANQWIRRMESENKLGILKLSDSDYMRTLENAIQFGTPVLLENVGEGLDPTLEPLLLKQIFKQGGVDSIRLGDATVEYSPDFRFYMTTKLRNPHYLPEVSVKVTLINFMITPEGLQDQLLGVTVQKERPDLEEQRNRLIVESSANKAALIDIEDRILRILSSSEGNILEDATAIDTLSQSKVLSDEINAKQEIAERTERSIDEVRREYQPIAHTSQVLFFAVSDLASVEPVYQYSLGWFVRLYESSIANSETSSDIPTRLRTLEAHFMLALYVAVCRSLLEKDKLLFSFLLVARIMEGAGELDEAEWLFLLTGSTPHGGPAAINPCPEWLLERAWDGMRQLSGLPSMSDRGRDLKETFVSPEGAQQWRRVYDSAEPHVSPLPYKGLTAMQRLCVLRCLRPDMMTPAIRQFVKERAGEEFVTPPAFDLETCFAESSAFTPLIFILSPGSDPMTAILRTAEKCGMQVSYISLGQGQGPLAEQMIGEAAHRGSWVVLQNCHLAPSWMMTLEKIVERLSSSHSDFRLWCTTYPSKDFPASVLQNGIKMTIEPPKGVRANLRGSFEGTMDLVEEGSPNEVLLRRLLFGLCFFHALVQERRLYGPIGWNIPYEFNESDLRISAQQLAMFVGAAHGAGDVPYEALIYTAGECNYGGRVTDDKDRRVLLSILSRFYCESATQEGYGLSSSGDYVVPQDSGTSACYIEHVDRMPPSAAPEVFGLHSNANISRAQKETANLFGNMLLMQGTSGGQVQDKDAMTAALAADIQARLPQPFDMEIAQLKYPVVRNESMNTVLCQELQRFNSLLGLIRNSLHEMQNAIKGLVVMSADLEILGTQLFFNRIPDMWKAASYPSLKPLSSYVSDLLERVEFFDRWLQHGQPSAFWICGFFFTQAFLTGALQNYARRHTVPIDAVTFSHEMLAQDLGDVSAPPQDGIYAHGLFLEGARWDRARGVLGESSPKVLFSSAPVVWFRPTKSAEETGGTRISYECPVYKTSDRRGILSTTGHSTNFICFVSVPSDTPGSHWIQRGVCMLTTLDD
jgi:dynein heavy chain